MITKISRGARPLNLMRYLASKGHSNEHHSQRLIDSSFGVEPAPLTPELVEQLSDDLAWPARAFPDVAVWDGQGAVWHCALSLAADEPDLSDAKWAEVSREFMDGMGFPGNSRWVVVGHGASANGNPHVHIAASLVTESGGTVDPFRDKPRSRIVANDLAHKHGLKLIASEQPGGPESLRSVSQAEIDKGRGRRDLEPVIRAAASLGTEQQFLEAMALTDTPVRPFPQTDAAHVTGYSVRIDDVWFGGGKVARDLSLPRLRAGWSGPPVEHAGWVDARAVFPLIFLATKSAEAKRQRIRLSLIAGAKATRPAVGRRVERRGSMTDIEDALVAPMLDAAAVAAAVAARQGAKQRDRDERSAVADLEPPPVPVADQGAARMAADHRAWALGPASVEQLARVNELSKGLGLPAMDSDQLSRAHADDLIRAFDGAAQSGARQETTVQASAQGIPIPKESETVAVRDGESAQEYWDRTAPSAAQPQTQESRLTPVHGYDKAVREGRAPGNWKTGDAPMTDAQRGRLVARGMTPEQLNGLTKAGASELIGNRAPAGKAAQPSRPAENARPVQDAAKKHQQYKNRGVGR